MNLGKMLAVVVGALALTACDWGVSGNDIIKGEIACSGQGGIDNLDTGQVTCFSGRSYRLDYIERELQEAFDGEQ